MYHQDDVKDEGDRQQRDEREEEEAAEFSRMCSEAPIGGRRDATEETEAEPIEEEDLPEAEEEVRQPKCVRMPEEPTAAQRKEHAKNHLPFRPWCRFCVMGRGRDRPHSEQDRTDMGVPTMGADYFFIGRSGEEGTIPAISVRDCVSKAVFAHVVPEKGANNEWAARQPGWRRVEDGI